MAETAAFLACVDALEQTHRAMSRISDHYHASLKAELLDERRKLPERLAALQDAGEALSRAADFDLGEFKDRLAAIRKTIAAHQSSWSVAAIDGSGEAYRRSAEGVARMVDAFLIWARAATRKIRA